VAEREDEADQEIPVVPGFHHLRPVGIGGFARVFAAEDEILGRKVALKVLQSAADRLRFERECRVLAQLHDVDGIVPVYQATFSASNEPVVVMGLMTGGSLASRIYPEGPLDPTETVELGIRLAGALAEANRRGVVHRDIKPQNVLFDDKGQPAIADFGIAVIDTVVASSMTVAALSPPYSPPERFGDTRQVDWIISDIYSLGATLSFALTGAAPFGTAEQGGIAGLLARIESAPPPDLSHLGLSEAFQTALDRSMAKRPQDRFASMTQFRDALVACRPRRSEFSAPLPFPNDRQIPPAPPPPPDPNWTIKTDPHRREQVPDPADRALRTGSTPPGPGPSPNEEQSTYSGDPGREDGGYQQSATGGAVDRVDSFHPEATSTAGHSADSGRTRMGALDASSSLDRLRSTPPPPPGPPPPNPEDRPAGDPDVPSPAPVTDEIVDPSADDRDPGQRPVRRRIDRGRAQLAFKADEVPNSFSAPVKHDRSASSNAFPVRAVVLALLVTVCAAFLGLWLLVL